MQVNKERNNVIIKDQQEDLTSFIAKLKKELHHYKNENIIIDLTAHRSLEVKDIVLFFADFSSEHRAEKKSFVIVVLNFNFDEVPDEIIVVPSILEAHDIIKMEEITRDLGF